MTDTHFEGLVRLNSDPAVMRYITGKPETRADTQVMIERVKARWADWGFSWWCFIELTTGELIGAGCIQYLGRDSANPLEIGWRLRPDRWGQGHATEAARAMVAFAFETVKTSVLCAVCDPGNTGSTRVMQRLGMTYRGVERWYEANCAVYQLTRDEWLLRTQS